MQTEQLKVTGMTCGGCSNAVAKALKSITGVGDVNVSLSTGEVTVNYDDGLTSPAQLKLAVKDAGYGVDAMNTDDNHQSTGGCCS